MQKLQDTVLIIVHQIYYMHLRFTLFTGFYDNSYL